MSKSSYQQLVSQLLYVNSERSERTEIRETSLRTAISKEEKYMCIENHKSFVNVTEVTK